MMFHVFCELGYPVALDSAARECDCRASRQPWPNIWLHSCGLTAELMKFSVMFHKTCVQHWRWRMGDRDQLPLEPDVTYREDESRIREQSFRENIAWLNWFTRSLLKQHPGKDSIVMKRRACGWSDGFLLEVRTGRGR